MLGLLPQALFTTHQQGLTGERGLSPRLWARAVGQGLSPDGSSNAYYVSDDFLTFGGTYVVASNVGLYASQGGCYRSYEDTGNSVAQLATEVGGVISITTDATDNDECWLQPGGAASVMGKISTTAGADKLLIWEARFRISKVTDTGNMFLGLTEEGTAIADFISDAGAISDKDYIGFTIGESNGDALKFVYKKAGQTAQTVFTYSTDIVLATWYRVGFCYNPKAPAAKRITAFIDNQEQGTYVTATNLAAATFPNGEELNMLAGVKNGSGAAHALDLDWYAFLQAG